LRDVVTPGSSDGVLGNGLSDRSRRIMDDILAGRARTNPLSILLFAGPAVIASIAYMDPGNFATNIQAGAKYGYALLWVVLVANLLAMMAQALSAKLGIVTGHNLAELCRDTFPKPLVYAMWAISEVAAMATDLAEFLGGAIGLALLFHMPLLAGMGVTATVTYALLLLDRNGFRPMELLIGGLVAVIALCYVAELVIAPVDWHAAALHTILPSLPDRDALTIAVGIVGATIMPHAVYLHSGLTQGRVLTDTDSAKRRLLRFSNREVVIALALAGLVNMAMLIMATATWRRSRPPTRRWPRCSAAARPASSWSRSSPPASRARSWARWPAR
jgi:manganese transport protein